MGHWHTLRFDFTAMASPCSLQMDGQDERAMQQAANAAIAEVRRIEHKFSRYREDSIISRINQAAGLAPVAVDAETADLLAFADQLWTLSDGLFDITSGVLRHAWDFKTAQLPQPARLQSLLRRVGWHKVERESHEDRPHVRLQDKGMELDFGGFGKEYATDRAAAILQQQGFNHALVNLGGDLHALGGRGLPEVAGKPWRIDIQHPRPDVAQPDAPLVMLPLTRGGLATSGDYERFFIHDGQRYCHILNPQTGWPVAQLQSVSVLAASTTAAGALSTIAMLKGEQAPAWLEAQQARFLAVQHDGTVVRSTTTHLSFTSTTRSSP
jgi:FAD:protein FMN transferase